MTRGADRLLDLLRWYDARFKRVYPKRAKLAVHLKVCQAQVGRYVKELRDAGLIRTIRAGRAASEYVFLQAAQDHTVARENARAMRGRCAGDARANGAPSLSLSSPVFLSSRTPRKPPRRETPMEWAARQPLEVFVNAG